LPKAPVVVRRVLKRVRTDQHDRSVRTYRRRRRGIGFAYSLGPRAEDFVARLRADLGAGRALPVGAVVAILIVSLLSFAPVFNAAAGSVGAVAGYGTGPRIAVGGGDGPRSMDIGPDVKLASDTLAAPSDVVGEDGTLLKPVAVDTTVDDGRNLIRRYTVQSGDTLDAIANKLDLNVMSLIWANGITSHTTLHVGQQLVAPPVDGLIVTVGSTDTLAGYAAKYGIDPIDIATVNGLTDQSLVIGQILILPGARGPGVPPPPKAPTKPKSPTTTTTTTTTPTVTTRPPSYSGGSLAWPVAGSYYISQYFWSGHPAIDIAASYGTPVVAATGGKVIFAGWKNNCGGYQVWLSHGNNFYTGYYHMSAVLVGAGQYVSRGQQIGRLGMSGCATGPHLHFETWIGPIWDGGYRVNPLNYY
jgi:murein DD-endopeptidase MepM/ murein hydrolase activator NlpD